MNRRGVRACALGLTLLSTACIATPDEATSDAPDESLELDEKTQAFKVLENGTIGLISKVHEPAIRVCLAGTGLTPTSLPTWQSQIREAILEWIDAVQPASSVTMTRTVTFACASTHALITVNPSSTARASANIAAGTINLFANSTYETLLHELGHLFGLDDTYVEGVFTCQPGQPSSLMCGEPGTIESPFKDDVNGIREVYCMKYPNNCLRRWNAPTTLGWWCTQTTDEFMLGDFNNDGRDDMLCHNKATGWKSTMLANSSGVFTGTTWTADMQWCKQADDQLLIGDFDNDGRDDMLCHQKVTGWKSIARATTAGNFTGTTWTSDMKWCNQSADELLLGDFNGDNRADMLCHQKNTGWKSISFANSSGTFTGTSWTLNMGWCNQSGDKLYVGDFNRDGRDDILCHNKPSGWVSTALANASGVFTGTSFSQQMFWCVNSRTTMHVGDFNGDERADMLCHHLDTGHKWIANADTSGNFAGVSRYWAMGWCNHPGFGGRLLVGDFNNDRTSDFFCFTTVNGPIGYAIQTSDSFF